MDVKICQIIRSAKGVASRRESDLTAEEIHFGRGANCTVPLPDPRILIDQATLKRDGDRLVFYSEDTEITTINGAAVPSAVVTVGTTVRLGPYEINFEEPPLGKDALITVELVEPLDDGLSSMRHDYPLSLAQSWLSARRLSWAFAFLIIGGLIAWPIHLALTTSVSDPSKLATAEQFENPNWLHRVNTFWNSGEISNSHKYLAHKCGLCHQKPFVGVRDQVCLACHTEMPHHVDPVDLSIPHIQKVACVSCHREHKGPHGVLPKSATFCADCHGKIKTVAKDTKLRPMTDFYTDHPQFRASVVTEASLGRIERKLLDKKQWPKERSNLRFPHHVHIAEKGIAVPGTDDKRILECSDCHIEDEGGFRMRPISMPTHCGNCHRLKFDSQLADRELPHGDPAAVHTQLRDFYRAQSVSKAQDHIKYMLSPEERKDPEKVLETMQKALRAGGETAEERINFVFNSVCNECHKPTALKDNPKLKWTVEPVILSQNWLPKARFHHASHRTMKCADCHKGVTKSTKSSDVLMPTIETCRQCHGGAAPASLVPSPCITCHKFHLEGQSAMTPVTQKLAPQKTQPPTK